MNFTTTPWEETLEGFATLMDKQLWANRDKGRWENDPWKNLLFDLKRQVANLELALSGHFSMRNNMAEEVTRRCANVANFAMMIHDTQGVK